MTTDCVACSTYVESGNRVHLKRGEVMHAECPERWVETWHEIYTHDHVASVDLYGRRFALTVYYVREHGNWLSTVDFGFVHRLNAERDTTLEAGKARAMEAARTWRAEMAAGS